MTRRLAVGVETSCKAPMRVERAKLTLCRAFGVDSLFLPDHLRTNAPPSPPAGAPGALARLVPASDAFFEPMVMLGMMAARYRRVRLGVGVTDAFRRHPATLAQSAVTLDHLSRGRAILGLGSGSRENVEPYGMPFANRVGRLEEALAIIRALWESDGEPVDFDGSIWKLRRALFATPLHRGKPPALWIAAHAPRMLELTGKYGDGWYPTVKMDAAAYRRSLDTVRASAAAAGRPAGMEPALQAFLVLGESRRRVLGDLLGSPAIGPLLLALPRFVWNEHGAEHPLGGSRGFSDFVPEEVTAAAIEDARRRATPELLAAGIFAGTAREVVSEVRPLVDAGLRHLVLSNIGPGFRGVRPTDLLRLATLIHRLKQIPLSIAPAPADRR
jgi:phthiodiolone/phenolphthiodiolone dimycocerosates ketoreductase